MAKSKRQTLEDAVIVLCATTFLAALWLYLTDYPLRKYFIELKEEESGEPIGRLSSFNGSIRQQRLGDSAFLSISTDASLFRDDTIVTGSDSKAILTLDDGGEIEIGPNSMLKLSSERSFSLSGVSRVPTIEVVSGNVQTSPSTKKPIILKSEGKRLTVQGPNKETIQVAPPKPVFVVAKKDVIKVSKLQDTRYAELNSTSPSRVLPMMPSLHLSPTASSAPSPAPSPGPSPLPSRAPSPVPRRIARPIVKPLPRALPSPSPKPKIIPEVVKVEQLAPKNGERLSVKDPTVPQGKDFEFAWTAHPAKTPLVLSVFKKGGDSKWAKISEAPVQPEESGSGRKTITLDSPGTYSWILKRQKTGEKAESAQFEAQFTVDPYFQGLETPDTYVAGEASQSNAFRDKIIQEFDLQLKWKPFKAVTQYKVELSSDPNFQKNVLVKEVKNTEWKLSKNKIYQGTAYARVSAPLPDGFIAISPVRSFTFKYLPPENMLPANFESFSKKAVNAKKQGGILITWRVTNFTESYELELASDSEFKTNVIKKTLKENFFLLKKPRTGQYWWRVKSISKSAVSAFSPARSFTVVE